MPTKPPPQEIYVVGDLIVFYDSWAATIRGRPLELSKRELQVLRIMAREPARVFTRPELYRRVWGADISKTSRVLDSIWSRLRIKLRAEGDPFMHTIRGVGVRLVDPKLASDDPSRIRLHNPTTAGESMSAYEAMMEQGIKHADDAREALLKLRELAEVVEDESSEEDERGDAKALQEFVNDVTADLEDVGKLLRGEEVPEDDQDAEGSED